MFEDLFNDYEIKGHWRLEKTLEPTFGGVLSIKPSQQPRLTISGGFHKSMDEFNGLIKFEGIWGETYDRGKVSLIDCLVEDSTANEQVTESVIRAQVVTYGNIFTYSKESAFTDVYLSISSTESWLNYWGIQSENHDNKTPVFRYEPLTTIEFKIPDIGYIRLYSVWSHTSNTMSDVFLKVTAKIHFKPDNKTLGIYNCIKSAKSFERLFQLLQGGDALTVMLDAKEKNSEDTVSIYFQPNKLKKPVKSYTPGMLFPYHKISSIFPTLLANWFKIEERFYDELELYSRVALLQGVFTHFEFLSLTQVIESFHRKIFPESRYIDQTLYDKEVLNVLSSQLPAVLVGDHRMSFKNRIKYGNEYSMRKKLTELIEKLTPVQKSWICNTTSGFVSRVVDSRNYYTHLSTDNEAFVLKGGDLFLISEKLQLLIEIYIFKELGISNELIEERFLCNSRRLTIIKRSKVDPPAKTQVEAKDDPKRK